MKILYEDDYILAIDKPRNIHVHPTKLSHREQSVLDVLQHARSERLFPVHRLDRPVGGILLMTKTSEAAGLLGQMFQNRKSFDKRYLCIVRGWMEGSGVLDKPMRKAPNKPEKEAVTYWRTLALAEGAWSDGIFPTSRYSLVECTPETGRYHQIRRHMTSASHPILGDIPHGDNPRNRIWESRTGLAGIMLRSHRLAFVHPVNGMSVKLIAPPDARFIHAATMFHWERNIVVD